MGSFGYALQICPCRLIRYFLFFCTSTAQASCGAWNHRSSDTRSTAGTAAEWLVADAGGYESAVGRSSIEHCREPFGKVCCGDQQWAEGGGAFEKEGERGGAREGKTVVVG